MHLAGSYRPGPLPAAIGPSAVLLWRPPGGPTPSAAWQVVVEGAPVGQVLPLLASTGSWTQLPDFALVLVDAHGLRVLVRGALRVQLLRTDGDPVHVTGADAVTWSESLVAGAVSATIASDEADQPEPGGLPVVAGVVNASSLTWTPDLGARVTPSSTPAAGITAPVPPPEPAAAGTPTPTGVTGSASSWAPAQAETAPAPAPLESPLAAPGPLPVPAPVAASIVAVAEPVIEQTLPPSAYDRPDAVDLAPGGDAETSLSYDLLYGTRPHLGGREPIALEPPDLAPPNSAPLEAPADAAVASPEPASPSSRAPREAGPVDHPVAGPAPLSPPEDPAVPAPWQAPAGPGLITSSPWRLSSAPAPDSAAGLPVSPFAGPAEATVRRGSAAATLDDAAAEDDDGLVEAVRCTGGHLNAPQVRACRVCGADVPFQAPARLPRPALGVLHLHGGAEDHGTGPRTVTVDRPLVLGRQPRASGLVGGELPALVTLPPPNDDISRSHVQVEIDGWRVLARDLGSANGTLLDDGTGAPERLDPQQPVELAPGARLIFSDDVSATFEAR